FGKRCTLVMRFVAILLSVALTPHLASAKRIASASVEPVVYEGIRYVAPNDDGRRAYIQAWDIKTNKKLWELTIFTNRIDPKLEEDVQWDFIEKLGIRDGTLMVVKQHAIGKIGIAIIDDATNNVTILGAGVSIGN